jgi:hypothetical protein
MVVPPARLYRPTLRFRRKRMEAFRRTFDPGPKTRILDVGGTETNWQLLDIRSEIVLLNIVVPETPPRAANVRDVAGDGTRLEYGDLEFDICFSNSTIEHVGAPERQRLFAREVRRVAAAVYVQTPARCFPFEPHWLGFGIHWLPRSWQRRLARYVTVYGWLARPTQAQVNALVDEYRLLTHREMTELFPDCEIRRERFLGLTKCYVAVRMRGD